jgi:23S rRNA U2552 (ribose-2'-O)-methylase RlmE/FtsJ
MSYFILPNILNIVSVNDINIIHTKESDHDTAAESEDHNIVISKSLASYLNIMKGQIDDYNDEWDISKKYTNTYEYIHTIIPQYKISVCKLKPLSRSYYKLIEIINTLTITLPNEPIKSFHLAEGPGGFIEALIYYRKLNLNNENDIYNGITLIDDKNENIPGWKKSRDFLEVNKNVYIIKGADNTGNILNIKNFNYCYNRYKNSIDFITADGGFDYSSNFNKQEILSINLILAQVIYAIALQKQGGTFILKVFDIFTQATIDILYILSSLYEKCYIIKPNTSRNANSEKYIVCKLFKLADASELINKLSTFFNMDTKKTIARVLNINIPYLYINKLEDINAILGQQQLENILYTLHLLDNNKSDKLELIKKNNIQKCIQWCIKNSLPYNKNINQSNIFT